MVLKFWRSLLSLFLIFLVHDLTLSVLPQPAGASLPLLRSSSKIWRRAAVRFASHALGEEPRDRGAAVGQGHTVTGRSQEGDNGSLSCPFYTEKTKGTCCTVCILGDTFFNIFDFFYALISVIFCLADCFKPCTSTMGSSGKWRMMISSFLQHQKVKNPETDDFCVCFVCFSLPLCDRRVVTALQCRTLTPQSLLPKPKETFPHHGMPKQTLLNKSEIGKPLEKYMPRGASFLKASRQC